MARVFIRLCFIFQNWQRWQILHSTLLPSEQAEVVHNASSDCGSGEGSSTHQRSHWRQQRKSLCVSSYLSSLSLMVLWIVGSILHGVDPLNYFLFQPVLHDWCNKGRGMCNPVCGMVHIKEPLLLIRKSSPCGGSGSPLTISVVLYHMSDAI